MSDVFSKEKRSEIMSRIRAKNTGIEKTVFSYLRKRKVYFCKHYDRIPGKPDIALPSEKKAVFINGDFWHGYRFGTWKQRIPKKYWRDKIESNIARDKKRYAAMKKRGWKILKVWGHDVMKRPEEACKKIEKFLRSKR
ncbi:MAG: hypothetical protein A3F22_01645 [Candidatus Magasanikbacteria bacterium RIFCSPHIGHO2_12_FULL_41_16]|nr:MAG: hypothetical protein A3F22_01645 [Candidatus Magasanikbacteria bacterium RIFCSPHIGHO2_12_FULL_41_16]